MLASVLIRMAAGGAVAAVAFAGWAAGLGLPGVELRSAQNNPSATVVDAELVLAVDVSYSMDHDEQVLQREGYMTGITSREFLQALRNGVSGKVAVTYFEWAGPYDQKIIVPWRLIDGPEAADAFADEIGRAPYRRASRTSISGALGFAKPLFADSGFRGLRRVIDVSGDGANNAGQLVTLARDDVLAAGITINGLPIMLKRPSSFTMDIENLDVYYEDCVIGGPGSFVVPSVSASNSRKRPAPSLCWRSPAARVILRQRRCSCANRASPAPSASRCGATAGETDAMKPIGSGG